MVARYWRCVLEKLVGKVDSTAVFKENFLVRIDDIWQYLKKAIFNPHVYGGLKMFLYNGNGTMNATVVCCGSTLITWLFSEPW